MSKKLTPAEIERRFAEINSRPAEKLTAEERASLRKAEAMDDGSAVSLDAFKEDLEKYSGKILVRIPKSLHSRLTAEAKNDGVSLNQYILYKLSQN